MSIKQKIRDLPDDKYCFREIEESMMSVQALGITTNQFKALERSHTRLLQACRQWQKECWSEVDPEDNDPLLAEVAAAIEEAEELC